MKTKVPILLLLPCALWADCVNFPAGLIPLTAVNYVTAANAAGDHLVVGQLAGGASALNALAAQIPITTSANQTFCDAQVQLAPQQLYANVYVPTQAELSGNFPAFAGLLVNPTNNQPYAGGIIPPGQLGSVFAFRIGAAQTAQAVRGWSPTGSAPFSLANVPTVVLPNGKIMLVTSPTLFYDPSTGVFTSGAPTMFPHSVWLNATLLDNGLLLIVGGTGSPSSAELYDPVSGKFSALPTMLEGHSLFSATKLNDGRVLLVGGSVDGAETPKTVNAGAELFDPKSKTFIATGPPMVKRRRHMAILLPDGRVLIAGGQDATSDVTAAEIYDPSSGKFSFAGFLSAGRTSLTAVLLPNGKVLIAGGFGTGGSAELFDPVKGTLSVTGSMASEHANGRIALLPSGQALVYGGRDVSGPVTALAETYNPTSGSFTPAGAMVFPRLGPCTILLPDGRVLVAGGSISLNGPVLSAAEIYTPVSQGLVTSQTGLTFRAAQASTAPASQTVAVLSPSDTIPWNSSVKTYSGGNWLTVTPANSNSVPGAAPVPLTITVNPTGLAAQDYYGAVTLTPTDQKHPPISIAVVLNVVPAGAPSPVGVSPTGQIFTSVLGTAAKPQSFTITNVTSTAVAFTAAASANPWFDFSPKSGTIPAAQSVNITVMPSNAALAAGVYRGSLKLSFTDGSTQTVDLLLVVSSIAAKSSAASDRLAAGCTPTRLLPVLTSLGAGFTAPVAWPIALAVRVVDDCGSNVDSGSVVVSFTSGDSPLSLLSLGGGAWTGTWVPVRNVVSSVVRADAQTLVPALSGTVQVGGQISTNPKVPLVASGGVLSSGDYAGSPAVGLLVSIFGTALADGSLGITSLPLPKQLGSTHVVMSGVELPLLYVSENQVNVLVPYDIAVNATHQLVVQRGNAISVPVPTAIFDTQPAILAASGNGAGQGLVYKADAMGGQTLADMQSPVTAGDVLVMYCVGLGGVVPAITAGDSSPASPLSQVPVPVTVTIGGQSATADFAGLSPGFAGLYQVNATVPPGITPGDQVPITVSVAGKSSGGSIYISVK